jgi:hypothetical protein
MMNQFVKPIPTKTAPKFVAVIVWACAIGAPALVIHNNLVEAARREAQSEILVQVASTIRCAGAGRYEVMSALAERQNAVGDARYIRAANRLGMPMDWRSLFTQIRKRSKSEQAKAAQIIAEECGLASDSTLTSEQRRLADGAVMVARPLSVMMPVPISAKIN